MTAELLGKAIKRCFCLCIHVHVIQRIAGLINLCQWHHYSVGNAMKRLEKSQEEEALDLSKLKDVLALCKQVLPSFFCVKYFSVSLKKSKMPFSWWLITVTLLWQDKISDIFTHILIIHSLKTDLTCNKWSSYRLLWTSEAETVLSSKAIKMLLCILQEYFGLLLGSC